MTTAWTRVLYAVVLVAAAMAVPLASAGDVYAADSDHELATHDAIRDYEREGVVSGRVTGLNMTLTVADKAGDVGLNDWREVSSGRVYLRVDYNEEISRTVRFFVPSEYWTPRLKEDLEAVESDATIDLEPTESGGYTAVTIQLDGPTDVVFAVPWSRGVVADVRGWGSGVLNNTTGYSLPGIGSGGSEWQYLDEAALTGENATAQIQTNDSEFTIQYDAAQSSTETQWVAVQSCDSTRDAPVCSFRKDGQPGVTYLLSTEADPPTIRYRKGESAFSNLRAAVNDLESALEKLSGDVWDWLPGGE